MRSSRVVIGAARLCRSRKAFPDHVLAASVLHEGYMMVIHDLDLANLAADLNGFQSDLYRLMQVSSVVCVASA